MPLLYTFTDLCRKCGESEKTLEKRLLLVYLIADFILQLMKTGSDTTG